MPLTRCRNDNNSITNFGPRNRDRDYPWSSSVSPVNVGILPSIWLAKLFRLSLLSFHDQLTPRNRIFFENVMDAHLLKMLLAFFGIQWFINCVCNSPSLALSLTKLTLHILISILILFSYLYFGISYCLIQSDHHHHHLAFREIGHCWPVPVSFFQEHLHWSALMSYASWCIFCQLIW
jgi:hypothetical protein